MNRRSDITRYSVISGLALAAVLVAPVVAANHNTLPLKAATMIIEYNDSAEDVGIQFFLDSDGWRWVEIFDPNGIEIFRADVKGSLTKQGGGTELFLESVEPEIEDLPWDTFFERFPEGAYEFRAKGQGGKVQVGYAEFTHDVPAGPVILLPVPAGEDECTEDVTLPVVIKWEPVETSVFGGALEAVRYEVIVENDDLNFDVNFPAAAGTAVTVSPELLEPGTEYIFEVLAIEESGNQTITEGCFTMAE